MKDNSKLIVRAYVKKTVMEEYVMDTTGMTIDEVKDRMEKDCFVEHDATWEWVNTEEIHSEVTKELEIQ